MNWHHFEDLYFLTISSYMISHQFWFEIVDKKRRSPSPYMSGDADSSSLISVNSDRIHKRLDQKSSNIELQFVDRTDECPYHLWSFSRNSNEVNYAFQHRKDDKSRVLFEKPIVWPVTELVPTMDQMLAGPGTT